MPRADHRPHAAQGHGTRRVIIADDEPLARERLRMLLAGRKGYEIVAECEDGAQAVDSIVDARPDLVFLDVNMPALDGLEVAEALGEAGPAVVFVTAFHEFAVRAFEVSAVDYLLKPVDRERFEQALARIETRLAADAPLTLEPAVRELLEALRADRAYPKRFLVRSTRGHYFVRADEIDWVDAQENYVRLHASGRAHLVRDTMTALEGKLNPDTFVRVHRSAIVNIDRVERIEPHARGEYLITLCDGTRLTSSRAHGERVRELLG
jgi:two-component system LytT family response regulator